MYSVMAAATGQASCVLREMGLGPRDRCTDEIKHVHLVRIVCIFATISRFLVEKERFKHQSCSNAMVRDVRCLCWWFAGLGARF